jgi:hypothetical protein
MATTGTTAALSSLIEKVPRMTPTSIELFQVGHSAPGTEVPIFHAILGDEILSYIALGEGLEQAGCKSHSASVSPGIDKPAYQILQVGYSSNQ